MIDDECEACGGEIELREEDGEIVAFCTICDEPEYLCDCNEVYGDDP